MAEAAPRHPAAAVQDSGKLMAIAHDRPDGDQGSG
jgi:hypothetical protein